MIKQPQKITAHTLKRIDKVLSKINSPIGTFELFFTLLGSMALHEQYQPMDIVKILISNAEFDSDNDAQNTIKELLEFSNAISFTLLQFDEGNFKSRDVKTLARNLCKTVLEKLSLETIREKYVPSIVGMLYESFESKNYDLDNFENLMHSIHSEYGELEELVHLMGTMMSMFSLCNTKEFTKILSSNSDTMDGFLEYFAESAINAYAMLDSLRKIEYMHEQSFQKEQSFEEVQRNDPCPCGSGKKYKKCCLAKNKNPLSALTPYKLLYKPTLSKAEVQNYYSIYNKLLTYVYVKYAKANKRPKKESIFNIMDNGTYFCDFELMGSGEISDLRDYFAKDSKIIDAYLSKEKGSLSELEQKTIKNFKNILYDQFIIMERINNSEVLAWNFNTKKIYLVYGLYDPISEIIPSLPCVASMILLEYEERIVYDGLMGVNNIELGNNMLTSMIEEYKNIRDTSGVVLRF